MADMIARRADAATAGAMTALMRDFAARMCRIWHAEAVLIPSSGRAGVLQ
jgi:hypothetical protein